MSAYPGTADIFFPTNFLFLKYMIEQLQLQQVNTNKHAQLNQPYVLSSSEFLGKYGDISRTRTITGYNPLLDDFTNTAFLLT